MALSITLIPFEIIAPVVSIEPVIRRAEPLNIKLATSASGVNAERGISNKPAPLPLYTDAETKPNILTLPVNSEPLAADITTNLCPSATDAVTLPLAIFGATNAGIFVN